MAQVHQLCHAGACLGPGSLRATLRWGEVREHWDPVCIQGNPGPRTSLVQDGPRVHGQDGIRTTSKACLREGFHPLSAERWMGCCWHCSTFNLFFPAPDHPL